MTFAISTNGGRLRIAALLIASFLLAAGSANAQIGSPPMGLPSLGLGTPGIPSPLGAGIPLGSVELGTPGLSSPTATAPFAVPAAPGLSGGTSSFGSSSTLGSPLGATSPYSPPGITGFGVGGMQTLPGNSSGGIP